MRRRAGHGARVACAALALCASCERGRTGDQVAKEGTSRGVVQQATRRGAQKIPPALVTICRFHPAILLGPRGLFYTRAEAPLPEGVAITWTPADAATLDRRTTHGVWWRPTRPGAITFHAAGHRQSAVEIAAPASLDAVRWRATSAAGAGGVYALTRGASLTFTPAFSRANTPLCDAITIRTVTTVHTPEACAVHTQRGARDVGVVRVEGLAAGVCRVDVRWPDADAGRGLTLGLELDVMPPPG